MGWRLKIKDKVETNIESYGCRALYSLSTAINGSLNPVLLSLPLHSVPTSDCTTGIIQYHRWQAPMLLDSMFHCQSAGSSPLISNPQGSVLWSCSLSAKQIYLDNVAPESQRKETAASGLASLEGRWGLVMGRLGRLAALVITSSGWQHTATQPHSRERERARQQGTMGNGALTV